MKLTVALTAICLSALAVTALGQPQTTPVQTAEDEAIKRQADTIALRQKLADAQSAHRRGDTVAAAKLYEDALVLVQRIGSGIDDETTQTKNGLITTRYELAKAAQRQGDVAGADAQITRALKIDPKNLQLLEFKQNNDARLAAQKGFTPSPDIIARVPEVREDKTKARTLVQDARLLIEVGKLDEAEQRLKDAIHLDP